MPYKTTKEKNGEYEVKAKDTGKIYHTKNPKKLERLHEEFKHMKNEDNEKHEDEHREDEHHEEERHEDEHREPHEEEHDDHNERLDSLESNHRNLATKIEKLHKLFREYINDNDEHATDERERDIMEDIKKEI